MLSGWNRLRHMVLFEFIALLIVVPASALLVGVEMTHTGALAVMLSAIAMLWNLVWNYGFDALEQRLGGDRFARGLGTRVLNAAGFELGLIFATVPLVAYWLDMTLWTALILDLGFVVFFLVYTLIFNWVYDRIFVIPTKAPAQCPA